MIKYKELTVAQKWANVDMLIDTINYRKNKGGTPCLTNLDEYINENFNKVS